MGSVRRVRGFGGEREPNKVPYSPKKRKEKPKKEAKGRCTEQLKSSDKEINRAYWKILSSLYYGNR